ncbi:peptidase S8 [Tengunoibacter tsumagoiensis]|uniref:Peptidase S8 n=2 Tax=Tengunoibacter tsumagoiensis TaxID=2014871 RepID=A0A402A1P4_9CHLR|nr:peptidase S8 [Tengunoibacter tsumagoiensis]
MAFFLLAVVGLGEVKAAPSVLRTPAISYSFSHGPYRACPDGKKVAQDHKARCTVIVEKSLGRHWGNFAVPPADTFPYSPTALQTAYQLPSTTAGTGQTIAIVDAYDDPNAESDLAVYRAHYHLAPCTLSNGCFLKLNQAGQSAPLPSPNVAWAQEVSIDLDMVSAICPNCHILLIEANSDALNDLGMSENTAIAQKANVVNNSFGSQGEYTDEASYCSLYFQHQTVTITASSGDSGPGVNIPAVCPYVTAVGGTSLQQNGTETAWSGSGGGCSQYISQPYWQKSFSTGCANRAVPDVAAVGDPQTGMAAYDTYGLDGWYMMAGTSASAPIIAGVYALTGNANASYSVRFPWLLESESYDCLNDIPSPENEYSFQTGLGSPNGIRCF